MNRTLSETNIQVYVVLWKWMEHLVKQTFKFVLYFEYE